ncbi:hypothetical protein [Paraburkholderia sp. DHOC27]|uniref:hypothetical protein n=1 Tax=Paraburkholderia sp. DHOC27 TaxID=2303330 RepID=UPI0011C1AA60|nr:hypothetical protein [Paraburkholderia sp. DHOC27]
MDAQWRSGFGTEEPVSMALFSQATKNQTLPRPCSSALLGLIVDDLGGGVERQHLQPVRGKKRACLSIKIFFQLETHFLICP